MVDVYVHRYSNIQYATRAGIDHAFVDCNEGILIHHDDSKSKRKKLDGGGIKVSLKRPRSAVSAAALVTAETTRSDGNDYEYAATKRAAAVAASLLQINNTGGTLTADYYGIGGLDQILFLPTVTLTNIDLSSSFFAAKGKEVLAGILVGSALCDGNNLVLPLSGTGTATVEDIKKRTTSDGTPLFPLKSIDPIRCWDDAKASILSGTNKVDVDIHTDIQSTAKDGLQAEVEGDTLQNEQNQQSQQQQPWKPKLISALKARLDAEERASKRRRRDLEVRRELVRRSRYALEGLSTGTEANAAATIVSRPAMVRLRYGTMPLNGAIRNGSLAVGLIVRIDVICIGGEGDGTINNAEIGLKGLHLSFSPASSSSSSVSWDASSVEVHSISGTVPYLRPEGCVSIMAAIDITGLRWAGSSTQCDGSFHLAINALWKDSTRTDDTKQGCVLGLLKLPHEALLLSSPRDTSAGFTHEIDFWAAGNSFNRFDRLHQPTSSAPTPEAIFEYRDPRVIVIDISQCLGGADGGCLRDMVDGLNTALIGSGGRNRVELCCPSPDDPPQHPRIIILAHTPEERHGVVRLVMANLPDSARVIGTTSGGEIDEDEEERKVMKVLLSSMSHEVKILDRHRRMASEDMRLSTVGELAAAQARSDEFASRVRRGWEA
mmetsp:Transcript_11451/g.24790  ORF Transcript_11451/g.24790 Transcript_11451/m.24790 type:complete len:661 (+) Transcript_11451:167-2149(+)